jgi:hypothetical protein
MWATPTCCASASTAPPANDRAGQVYPGIYATFTGASGPPQASMTHGPGVCRVPQRPAPADAPSTADYRRTPPQRPTTGGRPV